ncbi:MAG: hypothetical protein HXX09_04230 [Bacteroidetes bacterium]|nr:hypothetical protein [Bacteroidota bacterium]
MEEMNTTTQATPAPSGSNGMATTSLILGIVGFVLSFIPIINVFGILLDITAVILGAVGMGKAKKVGKGKGGAMVGLILGALGIIIFVIMYFVLAAAVSDASHYRY